MSRKQFKVTGGTHEKKITRKERREQVGTQQEIVPDEELIPTEEDTAQIKNLFLYSCIGIVVVLLFMYWTFINS